MDSIATHYHLRVMRGDGSAPIEMNPTQLPPRIDFTDFGVSMTGPMDSIYDKTEESPIPKGGAKNGVLLFFAPPGIARESLITKDTRYLLSFDDVLGKTNQTTYVWTPSNIQSKPTYIPGTPRLTPSTASPPPTPTPAARGQHVQ